MQFDQISIINIDSFSDSTKKILQSHSNSSLSYSDSISVSKNLKETDCLLIRLRTPIDKQVLDACPNLKYIGIYGTSKISIDLDECNKRNITVDCVDSYCDFETAEFVLMASLGLEREKVKSEYLDEHVKNKVLGVIGAGQVGSQLINLGQSLGIKVLYNSRTRKPELEKESVEYTEINQVLMKSDIISIHVPWGLKCFGEDELYFIKEGAALVVTSCGEIIDKAALSDWVKKGKNTLILDLAAFQSYNQLEGHPNVTVGPYAYKTEASMQRLQDKFIKNIENYLQPAN